MEIRNTLVAFKINLYALLSNDSPSKGKKGLFWRVQRRGQREGLTKGARGCCTRRNISPFVKFEVILPLLCYLSDSLTEYRRAWTPQGRTNNYLDFPRENVLGITVLLHLPWLTWKFFMVWHKIFKLIFQKHTSCPKQICAKHWRKLPSLRPFLEIFLYFYNRNSVEQVWVEQLCCWMC